MRDSFSFSLLVTKLHRPPAHRDWVPRPHLFLTLNEALRRSHRLILVSAPAGFGKTALITDWLSKVNRPAAWLSLGQDDNDPGRFWQYIIAAMQSVDAALGQPAQSALETVQSPAFEPVIAALINDLDGLSHPFILILDDYHVIDSDAIHTSLNFLLDRLPAQLCLVITTRVDPPLALSRRRALDQLTEVRAADLRFSANETAAFLNTIHHLDLPEEDITTLENRTEGWIVGLQLAALSLHRQIDRRAFVKAFAGDDRYVVDYLLDEVLRQQSTQVQSFLLQTSILDRLCGSLCDAVVGTTQSEATLHQLEEANLFIIPLDNRRYWYRYHHLFADLLRCHLRQQSGDWLPYYRRASVWYEREGFIAEAISQALAAPDFELAAGLLERHALTMFFRSEMALVHRWLAALPESILRARPLLAAVYANTIAQAGRHQLPALRLAESWLMETEQAQADTADPLVGCFIALSRAYLALWGHMPPQEVIDRALYALAALPQEPVDLNFSRFRSGLNNNLGMSYLALGDEEAAMDAFVQARLIGDACGDLLNADAAIINQCFLLRRRARLPEVATLCWAVLNARVERPTPYVGGVYVSLGIVLLEWNDLEAAESALTRGLELVQLTWLFDVQFLGYLALAYLQQAQGKPLAALDTLRRLETLPETVQVADRLSAHRARLWLMQGQLNTSLRWAKSRQFRIECYGDEALALIRVLIAQRQVSSLPFYPDLIPLLQSLETWTGEAEAKGWEAIVIEIWMLRGLALCALGDIDGAVDAFHRALTQAEPGGYIRLFLNEGQPARELIQKVRAKDKALISYTDRLLAAWDQADVADSPSPGFLIEPLSRRELEVLRLLATGVTNAELARELVISVNTAKKHVANILRKLDAPNRAKAVRRARDLGLLN